MPEPKSSARRPAPLLVADVPWLLYRSFFALPESIVGTAGTPVNALLGTVNALLRAVEACAPRAVVACTGAEEATYRVELYRGYHAHRDPMPAALADQWRAAPGLLGAFGWTVSGSERLEADDVMFSFAQAESEAGGRALLLTGDRDLYGAVGERVALIEQSRAAGGEAPGELREVGPDGVRERYGVEPAQVPDFIALRGDPSDGLPGAPGVGAKTAAALLARHGSLEAVLAAAAAGGQDGARRASGGPTRPAAGTRGAGPPPGGAAGMTARIARAIDDNRELLTAFREIATLQRIDVERPADRATDLAAGALRAGELGMKALSRRLARSATARA
ncbi:MAG: hypothetical protein KGJ43_04900 [Acidobacteriota bacterium]|nr:hypothetical protein [Acidobacteriota bacterium]